MTNIKDEIITWTRNHINAINPNSIVVIGISGGVDSTVCAAILKEAIGVDRILPVMLPCGTQVDIDDSKKVVKELGLKAIRMNILDTYLTVKEHLKHHFDNVDNNQFFITNAPARIRMTMLYSVAAFCPNGGLVVNTGNLSEDVIGYSTKFGDHAGDFGIINKLTKTEVKQLGYDLGLPKDLVDKVPTDGMSLNTDGSLKSDEDKLGFTYKGLDVYIRTGEVNPELKAIIQTKYKQNLHKFDLKLATYDPNLPNYITKENI
jgi:NAD+ synthase